MRRNPEVIAAYLGN
ncbi:hypothetical protein ACFSTC_21855 [Nonomuraea ferruginea]